MRSCDTGPSGRGSAPNAAARRRRGRSGHDWNAVTITTDSAHSLPMASHHTHSNASGITFTEPFSPELAARGEDRCDAAGRMGAWWDGEHRSRTPRFAPDLFAPSRRSWPVRGFSWRERLMVWMELLPTVPRGQSSGSAELHSIRADRPWDLPRVGSLTPLGAGSSRP